MKHFPEAMDPEIAEAAVKKVARPLQAPAREPWTCLGFALDTVAYLMGGRLLAVLSRF